MRRISLSDTSVRRFIESNVTCARESMPDKESRAETLRATALRQILPRQSLSPCVARKGCQLPKVFGIVHIHCKAGKLDHDAWLAGGLGRSMMRQETVVSKAQRKQIRRTPECGIRSPPVASWNEHAALRRSLFQHLFEFPRLDQRNIGGNYQGPCGSALRAHARGHLDCACLSGILRVRDNLKPIFLRKLRRKWIACHDTHRRPVFPDRNRA